MAGIKNNLIVTRILYVLEKQYSKRIVIVHLLDVNNNVAQGVSVPNTRIFEVKAIVLPEENARKHLYNAAFLSMGRNFVYGGLYDELATPIIVKASRVPDVKLSTTDYAVIDGVRYDFKHVGRTADNRSYHLLTAQAPAVEGEHVQ